MTRIITTAVLLLGLAACDMLAKGRERTLIADQLAAARQELALREAHELEYQRDLEIQRRRSTLRCSSSMKRMGVSTTIGEGVALGSHEDYERHQAEKQMIFELQLKIAELERKLKASE